MYPGIRSHFDAQMHQNYPSESNDQDLLASFPNDPDVFSEPSILPSSSTSAGQSHWHDHDHHPLTSESPSHVDNLPPLSFSNHLPYPECSRAFLPLPVTAVDQNHRDHRPATSNSDNLPSLSFSHPPFPDPNVFANTYVTGEGPLSSNTSLCPDFFDPHAAQYHAFSGPSQDVGPPYLDSAASFNTPFAVSFNRFAQAQTQDVLSDDCISSIPPDMEDVPTLYQSLTLDELLSLNALPLDRDESLPLDELRLHNPQLLSPIGDPLPLLTCQSGSRSRLSKPSEIQFHPYNRSSQLKLRGVAKTNDIPDAKSSQSKSSRIGPSVYDGDNRHHQKIFKGATETLIRSALNDNPFLSEQERKQQALTVLINSASSFDKCHGVQWANENLGEFYKTTSQPSAMIMSSCKKAARGLVQHRFELRPSVWLRTPTPQYQIQKVGDLVASFPPVFIFKQDEFGRWWAFENRVILDVVLDVIIELGYLPYLTDLKSLFFTASSSVQCALEERACGRFTRKDFAVPQFQLVYNSFKEYFETSIVPDAELLAWWNEYIELVFATLRAICS